MNPKMGNNIDKSRNLIIALPSLRLRREGPGESRYCPAIHAVQN